MKNKTKYDIINDHLETIILLKKNGLVSNKMMTHLIIFEKFHNLTGTNEQRYRQLGEEYDLKPDSVFRIIKKLKQKAK